MNAFTPELVDRVLTVAQVFQPNIEASQLQLRLLVDPLDDTVHNLATDALYATLTSTFQPPHAEEVEQRLQIQLMDLESLNGRNMCPSCFHSVGQLFSALAHLALADATTRYARAEALISVLGTVNATGTLHAEADETIHDVVLRHLRATMTANEILDPWSLSSVNHRYATALAPKSEAIAEALAEHHRLWLINPAIVVELKARASQYTNAGDEPTMVHLEALSYQSWWTATPLLADPDAALLAHLQTVFAPDALTADALVTMPRWAAETIRTLDPKQCLTELHDGLDPETADTARRLFNPNRIDVHDLYTDFDVCVHAARVLHA